MSYDVYVSVSGEGRIARYRMDAQTGALDPQGDVVAPGRPASIAIDANRHFLHVARRDDLQITSFAIDGASGDLREIGSIPIDCDPCYMAVDRSGRYLLSAYYLGERAAVHAIGNDGAVLDPPIEWRHTGRGAHCLATDPTNRFAFVPHIDGNGALNTILQFRFDAATGALTPNHPAMVAQDAGIGPRHYCFHPDKDLLYFSNEQGSSVSAYAFDPDAGTLGALQTVTTLPDGWSGENKCAQLHMTPDGRFLYAPNRGHDSIAQFAVDSDSGLLTPLGHAEAEAVPRTFAIDPAGRFLVSAGLESGRLATYRIGSDGRLVRIATCDVGKRPMWVAIIAPPGSGAP
jgi:6-phosphogluconolactonase